MAISTAAALIGSAVIGAGASYASSKSATKAASNAANYAADQNAQVNREIYNQTRTDLAPYNAAGQAGLAALMTRLGLAAPAATPAAPTNSPANGLAPTGAAPAGVPTGTGAQPAPAASAPNWSQYGASNPDVAAEWTRIQQTGNAGAFNNDPNAYYAWHYQTYGQPEGRPLPGAQPQTPAQPTQPTAPPMTPQQEAEQFGVRPTALEVPTFNRPADMAAPAAFKYSTADIENDPGYIFARDEGLAGVNASFAARGKVRSGDAAKALLSRASGVAHQWDSDYFNRALQTYNVNNDNYRYAQGRQDQNFLDDRSYGTNLWNTQQNRRDNVFSEDRGFTANRYDTNTGNLFNLVGVGQGAAAGTANAGNIFATNAIANNNARANTTANAAIAGAQNTANLFGSAMGAVGTYYGLRGTGSSASLPRTYSI